MSMVKLEVSRGQLRVALCVSANPAALAHQLESALTPEEFEAWLDSSLPPLLAACEKSLAQAALQLQSGLDVAWAESLQTQLDTLRTGQSNEGGAA